VVRRRAIGTNPLGPEIPDSRAARVCIGRIEEQPHD
jgi:hypothetical protein